MARWHAPVAAFRQPVTRKSPITFCATRASSATAAELFLDGNGARIPVPANSAFLFHAFVLGLANTGNDIDRAFSAAYELKGLIKNGPTGLYVAAVNKTALYESYTSFDASIVADTANSELSVRVTGLAAGTMRWVASVRTVEVIFPQ